MFGRDFTKAESEFMCSFLLSHCSFEVQDLEKISSKFLLRTYKRGDFFLNLGDSPTLLGFVLKGIFRFTDYTVDGGYHVAAFSEEGGLISDYVAWTSKTPVVCSIEALEDSRVAVIQTRDHVELLSEIHGWNEITLKLLEKEFSRRVERDQEFRTLSAEERFISFQRKYPRLAARVAQKDIAAFLGVTPVSLSRITAKLWQERKPTLPPV